MRAQTLGIALLLLIGSGLAFVLESYSLLVLSLAALTATVGVGLNILLGLSGQISLGHIGFYAIGAYTSALLAMRGMPLGLAAALGGLLSAFIGGLLALPALRVRGSYLAMVTISFAFIVHHGLIEWRDLTGGANGLMGIPTPSFGPLDPGIGLALCAVWLAGASLWASPCSGAAAGGGCCARSRTARSPRSRWASRRSTARRWPSACRRCWPAWPAAWCRR